VTVTKYGIRVLEYTFARKWGRCRLHRPRERGNYGGGRRGGGPVRGGSNVARGPPVTVTKYGIHVLEYTFGPFGPAIWPCDSPKPEVTGRVRER
jgi:hypothetical protein